MFDRAESTVGTESNWQQTWIMRVSAFCVAYVLMAYCTFFFLDRETFIKLTIEDSLFENLGAIYFLLTAVIFFLNVLLYRHVVHTDEAIIKKSVWYILFVIAFFFAGMEEINWGQRIFHLTVPEEVSQVTGSSELNLHNAKIFRGGETDSSYDPILTLSVERLFTLFWLCLCVIIPLTDKYSTFLKNVYHRLNIPIVPILFGMVFLLNYLGIVLFKYYAFVSGQMMLKHNMGEISESNFALLFLCFAILEYMRIREITQSKKCGAQG